MKRTIVSIILNQFYGKKWLLSEAIIDLVRIYTYFSGEDSNEDVSKWINTMVK